MENMASYLECKIDKFESELSPIKFFILPGGSVESSLIHISRSMTRRAETAVTALSKSQTINPAILIYLNRLSDVLFVAARLVNKRVGIEDVPWQSNRG
jgi:cob(I)alamin adenosyltransferase